MSVERILSILNLHWVNTFFSKFMKKASFNAYYYSEYIYISTLAFQTNYYFWTSSNYADFYWFLYIRELPTFSVNKTK